MKNILIFLVFALGVAFVIFKSGVTSGPTAPADSSVHVTDSIKPGVTLTPSSQTPPNRNFFTGSAPATPPVKKDPPLPPPKEVAHESWLKTQSQFKVSDFKNGLIRPVKVSIFEGQDLRKRGESFQSQYAHEFLEEARRDGYEVHLDPQFRIQSVKKIESGK